MFCSISPKLNNANKYYQKQIHDKKGITDLELRAIPKNPEWFKVKVEKDFLKKYTK